MKLNVGDKAAGYTWMDITSEMLRTYVFPDGATVTIDEPNWIAVSEHGHRIVDANGTSHYIPSGWIHLYWDVKPGEPNYVF